MPTMSISFCNSQTISEHKFRSPSFVHWHKRTHTHTAVRFDEIHSPANFEICHDSHFVHVNGLHRTFSLRTPLSLSLPLTQTKHSHFIRISPHVRYAKYKITEQNYRIRTINCAQFRSTEKATPMMHITPKISDVRV